MRAGDTLYGIAKRHDVSLASVVERNPQVKDPNLIFPGQVIALPAGSNASAPQAAPAEPASPEVQRATRVRSAAAEQAAAARLGTVPTGGTRLESMVRSGEILREGAKGPEVVDLQRFLGVKSSEQDGAFGQRTRARLESFQRDNRLPADGVVGPDTLKALKEHGARAEGARALDAYVARGDLIKEGDRGDHVQALQRKLGMSEASQTGEYDPTTRAAVEAFQRKHLAMTPASPGWGTVGRTTYEALSQDGRVPDGLVPDGRVSNGRGGAVAGHVRLLAQQDATSCGLTSVAMVANAWHRALGTGKTPVTDATIRRDREQASGAALLPALSRHLPPGVGFTDKNWPRGARSFAEIDAQLDKGNPVIVGLGAPFTASGYGHIFVLSDKTSDGSYVVDDPNGGRRSTVSAETLRNAGDHSEGSFYITVDRR